MADQERRIRRKLSAILAADVVGYSSAMEADDVGTLDRLKDIRRTLIDPQIDEHGGRIVKLTGDGLLAEFPSVVGATECAVGIQEALADRNADATSEQQMVLRVGVNLGDVIVDGDDIYGDGVNVAARLEGLAIPGGVCIAAAVQEQLQGELAARFADFGEHTVKNITRPIRTFAWHPAGSDALPARPEPDRGRKPTLAIEPLEIVGKGDDAEVLAAGINAAVVSSLSNLTGLTLLTDPDRADYVASGSIQLLGSRCRATLRLLDPREGRNVWSDRFDGEASDLFVAQEELAFRVSNALRFAVYVQDGHRADERPDGGHDSEALKTRAGGILLGSDRTEWESAGRMLDAVLARDPDDFMALTMKALTHMVEAFCGYGPIASIDGAAALDTARRATRLNDESDFAHLILGMVYMEWKGDLDAAAREMTRCLELNPYYAFAMVGRGDVLIRQGKADEGVVHCTKALEVSPRLLVNHRTMQSIALGHFVLGHDEEAIDWAGRSDQQVPDLPRTLMLLGGAYAHGGHVDEARDTVGRLTAMCPEITARGLRPWAFRDAEPWDRLTNALVEAGLPE